jgi:hypothetical protein
MGQYKDDAAAVLNVFAAFKPAAWGFKMVLGSASCGLETNKILDAYEWSCAEEVCNYASGNETGIRESGDSVSPVLNSEDKETGEDVIHKTTILCSLLERDL